VPDEAQLFLGVSTWPDPMAPLSLSLFGMTGTEAASSKSRHSSTRSTPRPKAPPPPQTPPPAPTNTEPPELIPAADIPAPDTQQPSSPEPPGRLIPEEDESVPEPPPEKSAPAPKIRQETLQFEPVTRGRFAKSEPTIVGGEDLDVPTFLRIQKKS
jgi:hypothetical protein